MSLMSHCEAHSVVSLAVAILAMPDLAQATFKQNQVLRRLAAGLCSRMGHAGLFVLGTQPLLNDQKMMFYLCDTLPFSLPVLSFPVQCQPRMITAVLSLSLSVFATMPSV